MANHGARVSGYQVREIDVPLACGHVLTFATTHQPADGENLWCPRCERETISNRDCFVVKCETCIHVSNYGTAKLSAQVMATRHAHRKRHTVNVLHRGKIITTHGAGALQLALDLEAPPF